MTSVERSVIGCSLTGCWVWFQFGLYVGVVVNPEANFPAFHYMSSERFQEKCLLVEVYLKICRT